MGSASCKIPKSSEQNQQKEDSKNITIGVFGLDNAGKTSTVKAIEGLPTKNVIPTLSSNTSSVPNPTAKKGDKKSQERVKIIDVSGEKRFRERSWSEYYDQIHGLIFVIDASEKKRIMENKYTLDDLLEHEQLRNKPILILANKQDRKGAINDEDHIKEKLQLEELKTKHKIEFCTALPNENNKAHDSIRQGFSWLIRTIENNYDELNARVHSIQNYRPPKPIERKTQINNKKRNEKSDQSENDEDIVYTKKRSISPSLNKKNTDYHSPNILTKLPKLDLNKTKTKTSGHETYSENDDDDDINIHSRSRPNISRPDLDNNDRNRSLNSTNLSSTSGLNTKKKIVGTTGNNNDVLSKKSNDKEPKSFRSTYEPFPEEAPWSLSTTKTKKNDDIISKPYTKPSITNDLTKRNISPLVRDIKPYNSGLLSKRDNTSDNDDDFNGRQKPKSTLPLTNRFKDNDDQKYSSSLSTNKSPSTIKKSTSGIYGADDDDDDGYLKKTTPKITKTYDSDDDNKDKNNKSSQRSSDRFNLNSEYRGTTSKPPPSPSITATRSKYTDDDFPSSLKPINRTKFNTNDYSSTLSKPTTSSRFNNDDDDDFPSTSKPINRSKFSNDKYPLTSSKPTIRSTFDDDDRPSSSSKPVTRAKYDDDDYKSTSKPTIRSKYNDDDEDDDELPSLPSKFGTRSKYDNDYSSSPLSKQTLRLKYDDKDRPSSPLRSGSRSKQRDDDLPLSSSKPTTHSKYDDDDYKSSSKPTTHSKYDDDDYKSSSKPTTHSKYDDDDYKSSSKPITRSKYDDDDDYKSSSKPTSHSKFEDDDYGSSSKPITRSKYDDDDYGSSSKPITRSKYDDDDDYKSSSKPTSHSKFEDDDYGSSSKPITRSKYDDDDDYGSSSKPTTRSKYDNDDDYRSSSKPTSHSKFEDDDYPSSSKKTNYSSRDDDYSGSARPRYAKDDFDTSKGGSSSARAVSASTHRFRTNTNFDT